MNNKTVSQKAIEFAEEMRMTELVGSSWIDVDNRNLIDTTAALIGLGSAAAHIGIIKPLKKLRFKGIGINDFFTDICRKVRMFGDDEDKALVDYAEKRYKPDAKFDDGMYGVVTIFSVGVTYYRDNFKCEKLAQWTYYYEDGRGKQYKSDIHIQMGA